MSQFHLNTTVFRLTEPCDELALAEQARLQTVQKATGFWNMLVRLLVTLVLFPIANAVMFGGFLVLIVNVPAMASDAGFFVAAAVKASLLVAGPLAWECAPALLTDAEKRPR